MPSHATNTSLAVPEIEADLLGAMIKNPVILADGVDNLTEDSFTVPQHRAIFAALKACHDNGQGVDAGLLGQKPGVDAVTVGKMLEVIPIVTMARAWREEIAKKQDFRRLEKFAEELQHAIATGGSDPAWLQEEFSYRLNNEAVSSISSKLVAPLDIATALATLPKPRHFVVKDYIPTGVVGLLTGTGGLGKSYLGLRLSIAVATGKPLPPFVPEAPGKVLLLNVEDDTADLAYRLHWTTEQIELDEDERSKLADNLVILPGRGIVGPLAQLDAAGNPTPSRDYTWLRQQVRKYDPALLILDTKSRLYGLEENSNDHAAQWLALLERLLVDHPGLSILVVSHTSKASVGSQDAHALRGASAIADNSRFALSLSAISPDEAKTLGLTEGSCFKLVHAKPSYAARMPPVFFRKAEHGVPVMIDKEQLNSERLGEVLDVLVDVLRAEWPEGINRRNLENAKSGDGRKVRDAVLEDIDLPKTLWVEVVRYGIESARLTVFDDPNSGSNNPAKLIRATWNNHVSTVQPPTVPNCQKMALDSEKQRRNDMFQLSSESTV